MKSKYLYLFLFVALLPVFIFRDFTPDNELRYLSIVDEAIRNGQFFAFTNHGIPYADKPPLYFWIIMLGKWMLGNHYMWFLSLFSIIPALITVATMNRWVSKEVSEINRTTATLLLMSSGLFLGSAVVIRMDMLMCMFITLSLYTFYRMLKGEGNIRLNSYLFPVYVFMAVFSKGPIGILVPLLSILVFLLCTGRIRTFGRYWGWKTWGVLLTGCVLWFGGVYLGAGASYLDNLLFNQTVNRAVNSFHHVEPFYYYLISVWYSIAPWSLLLIGLIVVGIRKRLIRTDMDKLFLTVIVVTFVMLSVISSKLAVYLVPAFPFFVYLAIRMLKEFRWNHWLALSVAVPALVLCLAVPALLILSKEQDTAFLNQGLFFAAGGVLTLAGIVSLYFLYKKKELDNSIQTLVLGIFFAVFVGGWAVPSMNDNMGYGELCRKAMEVSAEKDLSGYHVWRVRRPENMDVYLHKDIQEVTSEEVFSGKLQGTILMVSVRRVNKDAEMKNFLEGKETYVVGPNMIVVL